MNDLTKKSLLVVLLRPDDESFSMGGTLAKYAAEDVEITLICATFGELGIPAAELAQAASIREKELRAVASILGIHKVQCMRYWNGSLSNVDPEQVISQLMNAMRRILPKAVVTYGPAGIPRHPDQAAISQLVTTAFDRAIPKSFVPLSAKLFYIAPSEAIMQVRGVVALVEPGGRPVASIDISDYRLPKVRAMQAHVSQNPPYTGDPAEEADKLTCYEYFTLARPVTADGELNDLFTY